MDHVSNLLWFAVLSNPYTIYSVYIWCQFIIYYMYIHTQNIHNWVYVYIHYGDILWKCLFIVWAKQDMWVQTNYSGIRSTDSDTMLLRP